MKGLCRSITTQITQYLGIITGNTAFFFGSLLHLDPKLEYSAFLILLELAWSLMEHNIIAVYFHTVEPSIKPGCTRGPLTSWKIPSLTLIFSIITRSQKYKHCSRLRRLCKQLLYAEQCQRNILLFLRGQKPRLGVVV